MLSAKVLSFALNVRRLVAVNKREVQHKVSSKLGRSTTVLMLGAIGSGKVISPRFAQYLPQLFM